MGADNGAESVKPIVPSDGPGAGHPLLASTVDVVSPAAAVPSRIDGSPADVIPTSLDQLAADLSAIKRDIAERIRYDLAKEEAFNRLYRQLDELRSEREFDQLRPLYLDLILFFDRVEQSAAAALLREEVSIAGAVLTSLREELLEVLYRREVELIEPSPSTFDPRWQRAVGTRNSIVPEQHNAIAEVVRRGFRYRDRLIRPEEVVLEKCRPEDRP
jgi:molecular chaperone GrpE